MPSKRSSREVDSEDDEPRSRSRFSGHVSRACDTCRRKKMRCDGIRPQCGVCRAKGAACDYKDEDKRKTNSEQLDDLKSRMDRFEYLLETLVQNSTSTVKAPAPQPPSEEPQRPVEQTGSSPLAEYVPPRAIPQPPPVPSPLDPPTAKSGTSTIEDLVEGTDKERLQRAEDSPGGLVHFGPTSLWTYSNSRPSPTTVTRARLAQQPGDWVDWSRNLPPSLGMDRAIHDRALEHFAAFYAPWNLSMDASSFMTDLALCNRIHGGGGGDNPPPPHLTEHYSPLLHCCALFLGLYMIRDEYPDHMARLEMVFLQHCSTQLFAESDRAALSSLRAYNLYANCMHFMRHSTHGRQLGAGTRHSATGYIISGLAIAGVHALGLNINCESYVQNGHITAEERNLRDHVFWSVYTQDGIRALASGRQPMLMHSTKLPFPEIDGGIDNVPWHPPSNESSHRGQLSGASGLRSMRSTCLHWCARLAVLNHAVLATLFAPRDGGPRKEHVLEDITHQLLDWFQLLPLQPAAAMPLPHILLLHMYYHLTIILVHRPFYRTAESGDRSDRAATEILSLLALFDETHGIRFAHHNTINVVFGAATIFLLKAVGGRAAADQGSSARQFSDCVDYMRRLSATWHEAAVGCDILMSLQTEYLPSMEREPEPSTTADTLGPLEDLQQLLMAHDFSGFLPPDQTLLWEDILGNI